MRASSAHFSLGQHTDMYTLKQTQSLIHWLESKAREEKAKLDKDTAACETEDEEEEDEEEEDEDKGVNVFGAMPPTWVQSVELWNKRCPATLPMYRGGKSVTVELVALQDACGGEKQLKFSGRVDDELTITHFVSDPFGLQENKISSDIAFRRIKSAFLVSRFLLAVRSHVVEDKNADSDSDDAGDDAYRVAVFRSDPDWQTACAWWNKRCPVKIEIENYGKQLRDYRWVTSIQMCPRKGLPNDRYLEFRTDGDQRGEGVFCSGYFRLANLDIADCISMEKNESWCFSFSDFLEAVQPKPARRRAVKRKRSES